jgi:hypothetical protein
MEVYSDFQCPACKQLFKTTNQPLIDNYVNTGKVYLIHRDFPLPMHAHSREAASYARAAAHIGKFETVEQALFQNQEKWEASGDVKGTVAAVLSAAEMKKVQALVDGKTLEPLIEKDKQAGQMIPVSQTPTTVFHCKGQTHPYAGVMSYDLLKQFLINCFRRNNSSTTRAGTFKNDAIQSSYLPPRGHLDRPSPAGGDLHLCHYAKLTMGMHPRPTSRRGAFFALVDSLSDSSGMGRKNGGKSRRLSRK